MPAVTYYSKRLYPSSFTSSLSPLPHIAACSSRRRSTTTRPHCYPQSWRFSKTLQLLSSRSSPDASPGASLEWALSAHCRHPACQAFFPSSKLSIAFTPRIWPWLSWKCLRCGEKNVEALLSFWLAQRTSQDCSYCCPDRDRLSLSLLEAGNRRFFIVACQHH